MPYYAGRTIKQSTTIYTWASKKDIARQYTLSAALIVAGILKYNGISSHISIERV